MISSTTKFQLWAWSTALGLLVGSMAGCDAQHADDGVHIAPVAARDQDSSTSEVNPSPGVRLLGPHSATSRLAELASLEGQATPEGIRAALASDNEARIAAAIRFAQATNDRSLAGVIKEVEFHSSAEVRLAAASYLAGIGDEDAIGRMHFVADVPFKSIDAYTPADQKRLIEAVRALALSGHEGYAYQLTYIMLSGAWSARGAAAAALGFFSDLSDPSLEMGWLRAMDVLEVALTHDDVRLRDDAPRFAEGLLAGALRQETTTQKILDRLRALRQIASNSGSMEVEAQIDRALQHLDQARLVVSVDDAPGFVDDPRKLASSTATQLIEALHEGRVAEIEPLLDADSGVFEGMTADEWIEAKRLQYPPGAYPKDSWANQQIHVSRRIATEMQVDFSIDLLNRDTGLWEAVSMPLEVRWWGYGWHMIALDRFVDYEIVPDQPGEFGSLLALPERLESPLAPLLSVYEAMTGGAAVDDLEAQLADDGRFRDLSKPQFLQAFTQQFQQAAGPAPTIIPAEYLISNERDDAIEGQIQIVAKVEGLTKPARVNYVFRVIKREGMWLLQFWKDVGRV